METIDVAGLSKDRIEQLKNFITIWKQQDQSAETPTQPVKRKVSPDEFVPHGTKFKAPLTRDLAYED